MSQRIERLIDLLLKRELPALLITHQPNIHYLTGYCAHDSYLLVCAKQNVFITDSRYIQEARENLRDVVVKQINKSVFESIAKIIKDLGIKKLGFESKNLVFLEFETLKKILGKDVKLIPAYDLVESQRVIKDIGEVKKIKEAISLTSRTFKFLKSILKVGIREIDIAAQLEHFIKKNNAISASFPLIIASGKNSAYPHASLTKKTIKKAEPILIDIGVDLEGYKSDLTRMFFLDKISLKIRRIYDIVLEAQNRAINQIKPGRPISQIDKAGREYIAQKGYGKFFGHNLGHGIGLEVHEAPPISSKNNDCVIPGMVFTIEPAIYLPGEFGIRLEDIVLVTNNGAEVLSGYINKST